MMQFQPSKYGFQARFKFLVLVGGTQQGKTSKGMSLMGPEKTYKVSCGGCSSGVLPSLSNFDRDRHQAVLFDEVRTDQVIHHREVFQSNQYVQTLGSSPCNPYAYSIWSYFVPFILCCNEFDIESTSLSAADQNWLSGNAMIVTLKVGEKWFLD